MSSDIKQCPRCGNYYTDYPALSRYYNVDICPACGLDEALRGMVTVPKPASEWFRDPTEIVLTSDEDEEGDE